MTNITMTRVSKDDCFYTAISGFPPTPYESAHSPVEVFHKTSSRTPITRNAKSASGWRMPSGYYRLEEEYTPYLPGTSGWYQGSATNPDTIGVCYNGGSRSFYVGKHSIMTADSAMESAAITRALAKLKNQDVNLSVAFGERAEAAEMMVQTVTGIARSVKQFRTGNPKQWLRVIRNETGHGDWRKIPDEWLELQYGWKPLMSDVHGACQALNNRERDGDAYRATVKSTMKQNGRFRWNTGDVSYYNYSRIDFDYMNGVAVRLDYTLENPLLASLAQLGITNPAELVWELLPYSFVIDWFVPVGNYLSCMDAALGWSFLSGTSTYFARQKGEGQCYGYTYSGYYHGTGGSQRYRSNQFYMDRRVYSSSPLPRFPGLKNPFPKNGMHIANAMSLLVSAFR